MEISSLRNVIPGEEVARENKGFMAYKKFI